LHTDKEFAGKSIFKQRIAHGALTFSVMTGLWDQLALLRETVIAFYGVDRMRFISPVHINDTIHLEMEVIKKQDKGKDGLVTLSNEVINQKNEIVMVCQTVLLMKKK